MRVSELIEILRQLPQDLPVIVAYDDFVCAGELETGEVFALVDDKGEKNHTKGVYICAMDADEIAWHIEQDDFLRENVRFPQVAERYLDVSPYLTDPEHWAFKVR